MKTTLKISISSLKVISFLLCCCLFFVIIAVSCSKDEHVYSCNPQVNEWTLKHKKSFNEITRSQLVQIPRKYQLAVYRALSPEKKLAFWQEKLGLELSNEINPVIKQRISELSSSLKLEYYDLNPNDSIPADHRAYLDKWEKDMLSVFNIDTAQFVTRFCTLLTKEELYTLVYQSDKIDLSWLEGFNEMVIDAPPGGGGGVPVDPECECIYDVYCSIFLDVDCEHSGCSQTNGGCGVTGTSNCKGKCSNSMAK